MLDGYKTDLTPENERDVRCTNHPERRGSFLRRMPDDTTVPICAACWREDHIQGAITTDRDLINRAPLTPAERAILIRRLRG